MDADKLNRIDEALDEALAGGIASESISTPNGGSRSISNVAPDALIRAKRARLADVGARVLVKAGATAPFCVSYPTFN